MKNFNTGIVKPFRRLLAGGNSFCHRTVLFGLFMVLTAVSLVAQPSAGATSSGTNGASTVYAPCTEILRFDNYDDALASSPAGQNFVFTLTSGDSLFLHLTRTGEAIHSVSAPSWSGSAFGNWGYNGTAGNTILYQFANGTTTLLFDSIMLKDRTGNPVSDFTMIGFDGEATGAGEFISLTTDSGLSWYDWDSIVPASAYSSPTETGTGTNTVVWTGNPPNNINLARSVAVHAPSFISVNLTTIPGREGFAMGIKRIVVALPDTTCSGATINIVPLNAPQGTTYAWPMPVINPPGSVTGITAQTTQSSNIIQTLTDTGSGIATVTYTITPTTCGLPDNPFTATVVVGVGNPVVHLGNDTTLCGSTSILLNATNANSIYRWQDNSTDSTYSVTSPGNYSVTVTNARGCQASGSVLINYSQAYSFNLGSDTSYCGSFIRVLSTGIAGTLWSTGVTAPQITINTPGNYWAEATNFCGTTRDSINIIQNALPVAAVQPGTAQICLGASATLTASGGVSYIWSNADNTATITVSPAGITTYTVTVTNANNCSGTGAGTIMVNPLPAASITALNGQICFGSGTVLNAGGGVSYVWSNAATTSAVTVSPIITSVYTVTVTDANACTASAIDTLTVNPLPVVNFTANAVCAPGPVLFSNTSTGLNNSYSWNFGDGELSTQQNPLHRYASAGVYHVKLIAFASNQCVDSMAGVAVVNPKPVADFSAPGVCGKSASVFTNNSTVSTGNLVDYAWQFGDGSFSAQQNPVHTYSLPGTYTVLLAVKTDSGCVDTFAGQAVVYQKPTAGFTATSPCIGHAVQFTDTSIPAGLITAFNWTFGDGVTSTTQNPSHRYTGAGNFNVAEIVTTVNGCTDTAVEQVNIKGRGIAQFNAPDICLNDSTPFANATDTTGYMASLYTWKFGDGYGTSALANPVYRYTGAGVYTVTLIADFANGCADTAEKQVSVYALPTVNANVTNVSCNGYNNGSIQLEPVNGLAPFTFLWSNNSNGAFNSSLAPQSYGVTFTDSHQCSASAAFNITEPSPLLADTIVSPVICFGADNGAIEISATGATPPYSYNWNTGSHSATISNLSPGNYEVTVTDALGCLLTESVVLLPAPKYEIQIEPVYTINLGDSVKPEPVALNGNAATWEWTPADYLSCTDCQYPVARPVTTFTYTVQSTSDKGCVAINQVEIIVIPVYNVFIPNAFTPNGDGNNDYFEVYGDKSTWKFFEVSIFDRWGEKVYESNDMNFVWDGTFRGKPMSIGVYVYEIHVVFIDDHTDKIYKGSVTLIR